MTTQDTCSNTIFARVTWNSSFALTLGEKKRKEQTGVLAILGFVRWTSFRFLFELPIFLLNAFFYVLLYWRVDSRYIWLDDAWRGSAFIYSLIVFGRVE